MAIPEPDAPRNDSVNLDPDGARRSLERIGHIAHSISHQITKLSKDASTMVGNDERFTAAVNLGRQHGAALDQAHAVVGDVSQDIAALRTKGIKAVNELTGADADAAHGVRDAAGGK